MSATFIIGLADWGEQLSIRQNNSKMFEAHTQFARKTFAHVQSQVRPKSPEAQDLLPSQTEAFQQHLISFSSKT